jgi:hypothetical protein
VVGVEVRVEGSAVARHLTLFLFFFLLLLLLLLLLSFLRHPRRKPCGVVVGLGMVV